jgi:glycosyltransferase involved in cell wall biosynthesis
MKNLLWVNGWPAIGGAERAQLTMFRELAKRVRIHAVFPEEVEPSLRAAAQEIGISHARAPLTQLRQTADPQALIRFAVRCARANAIVYRLISEHAIDLVQVAYLYDIPFCAAACRARRVPLFWWIENPERFNTVNRIITNACRLDAYVGTSTAILNEAIEHGLRAPVRGVVPNPYDETVFFPAPTTQPIAPGGERFRVGFAGLLDERKGVLELCRAFVALCQKQGSTRCELWLAGRGPEAYKAEMLEVLERGGVRERVLLRDDLETPQQMADFYRSLDAFVMLSKREGLSVAMLEASACGIPAVVLSPWGDDVIRDGETGLIVHSDQPNEVARALSRLAEDAVARRQMGTLAALHLRRNFSSTVVAARMAERHAETLLGRRDLA